MTNVTKEEYKFPSGTTLTMRYNNNKLHDHELPAITLTTSDGLCLHMHFKNGKLESIHPKTLEVNEPGGASVDIHFCDGRRL